MQYFEERSPQKQKISFAMLIFIQCSVCLYTLSGIAAKMASRYDFLSLQFLGCYGAEIFILGVYAILWQQIIKRVDITIAYSNRSIAIFWSTLWAVAFFHETISLNNILGIIIVFLGTWVINKNE